MVSPATAAAESVLDMQADCAPVVTGVEYQAGPPLGCMDDEAPDKSVSPMVRRRNISSLFQSVWLDTGAGVVVIDCA